MIEDFYRNHRTIPVPGPFLDIAPGSSKVVKVVAYLGKTEGEEFVYRFEIREYEVLGNQPLSLDLDEVSFNRMVTALRGIPEGQPPLVRITRTNGSGPYEVVEHRPSRANYPSYVFTQPVRSTRSEPSELEEEFFNR